MIVGVRSDGDMGVGFACRMGDRKRNLSDVRFKSETC